ncbi:MAG: hypothetical protein AB1424_10860 [Thermodesulfobacteriota bacterium]
MPQPVTAKRAWAVSYTPQYLLEMGQEYDNDRLGQLNEHLAKGDYALLSDDTQGFPGDLVIDFPAASEQPYTAIIQVSAS